jgi:tetratricopeptide (TPR) repeat protein
MEWRSVLCALLAALLLPSASPAEGAPPVLLKAASAGEFVTLGMPLSARRELLSLPPGDRGKFPLLPRLLRQLAAAGYDGEALSLFAEIAPVLAEPVRSEAFLAVGKIHWRRKDYRSAESAFREVSGKSAARPEAAYYLGRILASGGNTKEALVTLASAPPGAKTALSAGEIERGRGNLAKAIATWRGAADGTPAGFAAKIRSLAHDPDRNAATWELQKVSRSVSAGTPEQSLSLKVLTRTLLRSGNGKAALEWMREGISGATRWRNTILNLPEWDGTEAGARDSWDFMAAQFPYGVDASGFFAAGGRFLALAEIEDTLGSVENGIRRISLRIRGADQALAILHDNVAARIRRAEEIQRLFLHYQRQTGAMRGRLKTAADSLVLAKRGKAVEPKESALLDAIEKRQGDLRERLARLGTAFKAKSVNEWSPPLAPEDRIMVLYAQIRLSRIEDSLRLLEGKAALIRGKVWNRWKTRYVMHLSRLLAESEKAMAAAPKGAARAKNMLPKLLAAYERQELWPSYFRKMNARLAQDLVVLSKRREGARKSALGVYRNARKTLLLAVEREERAMQYLAARAATEWLIEGKGSPSDNAVLSGEERKTLLDEAVSHWEAALPPGGEGSDIAGEALYALAELRLEEAEARFFEQEEDPGRRKDYAVPISLFRRVLEEVPGSPYEEPALYGLAVAHQEVGATDNSIGPMETLLARYPNSRFSNEVSLRLGEFAFDRFDFRVAEEHYRKVRENAPPDLLTTARFKLGWSLFLQERPANAAGAFLSALLLSPSAQKTGGVREEATRMLARSLVDAGMASDTENFLAQRGAAVHGPKVLLQIQSALEMQNRYEKAAEVADRFASAYPLAAERVNAEIATTEALRKGKRLVESYVRKRKFHEVFGPGSKWQAAPGRTAGDIARANVISEEGLRTAAFYFHGKTREAGGGGGRGAVLESYDTYLLLFPTSPKTEEVAYQRAWLLFEAGRKKEAGAAFEAVARKPGGAREEPAWYMAVQSVNDTASKTDRDSQTEVVRLAREYERALPKGERIAQVLLDRGRAHFNLREFAEAAETAHKAALLLPDGPDRRKAQRLSGDARFQISDYAGAEKAFREILAGSPTPKERQNAMKWVAFSLFRRAEEMPPEKAQAAADLFTRVAREFPTHEIAQTAMFRAGTASVEAGKTSDAITAFLAVESAGLDNTLGTDSTRWLARLYEKTGDRAAAAERYERLGAKEVSGAEKGKLLLRAAELFTGNDEARSRRNFAAGASLPETPPDVRMSSFFRAAESARAEGKIEEADRYFEETVNAHRRAPSVLPEVAGKALFQRAEFRFARYRTLSIVPPLTKTFAAKQAALEASASLYVEAVRIGDADTISASLHRLGEGFEDFRTAILASPPPRGLSEPEREEYVFLLEEKAAPIEEKAIDAYQKNLRQAVAADFFSPWVKKTLNRLIALRPARFAKKREYAFPVVPVPEFVGVIERGKR